MTGDALHFDALHDELAELTIGTGEYVDRAEFYRARLNGREPLVNPNTHVLIFLAGPSLSSRQENPSTPARLSTTPPRAGATGHSLDRCPAPASRTARHAPAAGSPSAGPPCEAATGANGAPKETSA